MTRVQPAARAEPEPPDRDAGDPVATFLRRRPARTGMVLTQPPPPPPVPGRGTEIADEPGDHKVEASPRPEARVQRTAPVARLRWYATLDARHLCQVGR